MRVRALWIFSLLVFVSALPATAQWASPQLVQTLATLRNLSDSSFQQVVWWAPNPNDPGITVPDWNDAEHQIMQLGRHDRDAVLAWLRGQGRRKLYDRGATNAMIGRTRSVDNGGTPATPSPLHQYRVLQLTSQTLGGSTPPPSGITIQRGFALIAKNGTKAIVCISFTNVGSRAAKSVHFTFPLVDASGNTVGKLDFTRTGLFSPNVAIAGPASASDYVSPGFSNRGAFENCVNSDQGTAALPLLQAQYVTYKVAGVTYADGSTWP